MGRKTCAVVPTLIRKTFADTIVDNFARYNRRGYYQRICFVAKNKVLPEILKEHITECTRKADENLYGEIICGCCLYYTHYSIYLIEGLEDIVGTFMEQIVLIENSIFESAKLLIIINNIRKCLFGKFVFRTAEPPTLIEKFADNDESTQYLEQGVLITRYILFCREISGEVDSDDESEVDEDEVMTGDYTRLLISTSRMEFVLSIKDLLSLSYYLESFRKVPTLVDYDEKVWPIPYDYTPVDVFAENKYDVNLTFPNKL